MHLMHDHLNTGLNCVLFQNERKVQNHNMKEILSKAFNRKQNTQNVSSKH